MKKIKKPLSLLLSLLMLMTALPIMAIPASAVSAAQLDDVLSHLPNERNAHYYKDSTEAVILAAREAAEAALETGEGIAAAYNQCQDAFDEAWACDEVEYNDYGDTVFVFVNRDESKAHATLYFDTDASDSLKPGDTFNVTFSIKADFPLRQFRVAFAYDKAVFEADGSSITYAEGITDLLDVNSAPLYTEYGYVNGTLNKSRQYYPAEWDQETVSKYNFVVKEFGRNAEKDANYMLPAEKTEIFTISMKVKDDAGLVGKTGEIFLCDEMLSTMENDYLFDGIPALPIKIYRGFSTNPYEEVADTDYKICQACKVTDEGAGVGQTITWDGTALKTYSIVGEGEDEPHTHTYFHNKCTGCGAYNPDFIVDENGVLTDFKGSVDENGRVIIPDGIKKIGNIAFDDPDYLKDNLVSVIIPASVEEIENSAFYLTEALSEVIFLEGSKLTAIGESAFYKSGIKNGELHIYIPASVTSALVSGSSGNKSIFGGSGALKIYMHLDWDSTDEIVPIETTLGRVTQKYFYITVPAGSADLYTDTKWDTAKAITEHTHSFTGEYFDLGNGKHCRLCECCLLGGTESHNFVEGVCACGAAEPESAEECFVLATEIPAVEDQIIIAFKSGDKYYALPNESCGSTSSIAGKEITVTNGKTDIDDSVIFEVYKDKDGNPGIKSAAGDNYLGFNSNNISCNAWGNTKYAYIAAAENGMFTITSTINDPRGLNYSGTNFTVDNNGAAPVYIFVKGEQAEADDENQLAAAKEEAADAIDELIDEADSDAVKALAAEAKEKIADAATAEEAKNILDEYTDKINYQKLSEDMTAEFNGMLGSDRYSDKVKSVITDALDEMENTETYEELNELYEETQKKIELEQTREEVIFELEMILNTEDTYSDTIKDMVKGFIEEAKEIDNTEDLINFYGECDVKLAHQYFKDCACDEIRKLAGENPSEEVMDIINAAISEIQNTEETPDFDDIYIELFIGIIDKTAKDVAAQRKAEAEALAEAISAAQADLVTAQDNVKSDEAAAILEAAISALDGAESLDDVDTIKSEALENAKGADDALAEAIAAAKSDLETAKTNAKSDEAKTVIDDALAKLTYATNIPEVSLIVDKANTDAAEADAELAEAIATAKAELEGAKKDYVSGDANLRLNRAITSLDEAENLDDVNAIVEDTLKAAAQADKELADAKADARENLGIAMDKAKSDEAKAIIEDALAELDDAINIGDVEIIAYLACMDAEEADGELAGAIATAKENLETAKENAASDEAKTVYENAIAALDNATSLEAVETIVETADINAEEADNALAEAIATAKSDLETAKENAKSDEAKDIIEDALAELDEATNLPAVSYIVEKANADAEEADGELAEAIATAKSDLETAKTNAKSDGARATIATAINALNNAKSLDDVENIKKEALTSAEEDDNELAGAIATAKADLEAAKTEAVSDEAKAALDKAIENVEKAKNPGDVDFEKSAGTAAAANADKTLADTITTAKANLETAKNDAKSDAAKAVYTNAIAALDNAKSMEAIETIVEGAEMNAANADKALADAKEEAIEALEEAKTEAVSDEAKAAIDEAIEEIEKATNPEAVAEAKADAEAAAAEADKALADAKEEAVKALEEAKTEAVSDEAKAAIDEAIEEIEKATNPEAVAEEKKDAEAAAAAADKALDDAKEEAIEALEAAKEEAVSDEAKAAIDEAIEEIEKATNPEAVAEAKADAETAAAEADKALADAQAEAVEALEAAKEKAVSDEAKAAIDEAIEEIENATNLNDVAEGKANGEENAEAADEALAEAIAEAKEALEEEKENAIADDAKEALEAAIEDIDNATSLSEVADKKADAEETAEAAEKELADAKAEAIRELEEAAGTERSAELKILLKELEDEINSATNPEAAQAPVEEMLEEIEYQKTVDGFELPDEYRLLGYNETTQLHGEAEIGKIVYTSSNPAVATVDENGLVTAVSKGECVITAAVEGTDISDECKIEVKYNFFDILLYYIHQIFSFIKNIFKSIFAF